MLQDIVDAIPLDGHRLRLRFEDGVTGVVDVRQCVSFTGVFAPLRDRAEFAAVQVNPELAPYVGRAEQTSIRMCCTPSSQVRPFRL
jgi:hypothetical protein